MTPSLVHDGVVFPVDAKKWKEASARNPNPATLYPALVMGADELEARQKHQSIALAETRAKTAEVMNAYA